MTNVVSSKRIIYIPPNLVEALSSPDLLADIYNQQSPLFVTQKKKLGFNINSPAL